MAGNRVLIDNLTFHKNATQIANGIECPIVSDASTLSIDFTDKGVNSIFEAVVEGKVVEASDWKPIRIYDNKLNVGTLAPSNFNTYKCSVVGQSYIRIRIVSITGNISIFGRLVG